MRQLLPLIATLGSGPVFVFFSACDSSASFSSGTPPEPSGGPTSIAAADRADTGRPVIQEPPGEYSNLQVLPETITKTELLDTMKLVTKSLDVKCNFCHRTDVRDYASDEIEKKVIAREMMRMVEMINGEHFTWSGAPEATCFMCHHGQRKPRMHPTE